MDIDDGVEPVILAGQKELCLDPFDECPEFGDCGFELFLDGLAFTGKVYEGLGILNLTGDLPVESESFFESGALL